jgi:hypothetical protein
MPILPDPGVGRWVGSVALNAHALLGVNVLTLATESVENCDKN